MRKYPSLESAVLALRSILGSQSVRRGASSSYPDSTATPPALVAPSELQRSVRILFDALDENACGTLTAAQLRTALHAVCGVHVSDVEAAEIICAADHDGDDALSFDEFFELVLDLQRIEAAFASFDSNADGFICRDELHSVLVRSGVPALDEVELDSVFLLADVDGDGSISFDDYGRFVMRHRADLMRARRLRNGASNSTSTSTIRAAPGGGGNEHQQVARG